MDDDKVRLGVLWKHVSRKGNKPYLSGRVQQDTLDAAVRLLRSGGRFLILSNTKRPDKQDPDCVLSWCPNANRATTTRLRSLGPGAWPADRTAAAADDPARAGRGKPA